MKIDLPDDFIDEIVRAWLEDTVKDPVGIEDQVEPCKELLRLNWHVRDEK